MSLLLVLLFLESYFMEVVSSENILDFKICQKKECFPLLDNIIPLKNGKFLILLNSSKKVVFYKGNKRVEDIKIINEGTLGDSIGTLYIGDIDLKKYDYFLRKDEKGLWKLDCVKDKRENQKELIIGNYESKKLERETKRAIYLWDTIDIIKKEREWKEILRKLKFAKVERIYIQIPYELYKEEENLWIKKRGKSFYRFLKYLMDNDFEIEILDGYKGFALEPLHFRVINQISYFKYFWEKYFPLKPLPPFHLDIEPYTLRFYNNKNYKEIYGQYLNLLKKIRRSFPDLQIYLDIPFWLDTMEGGEEILEEILDASDGYVVMAYRSKMEGTSGVLDISKNELNIAKRKNKKICLALETQKLPTDVVYKLYEAQDKNFPLFLKETKEKGLFILSSSPGNFGIDIYEETPPEVLSFFNKSWEEIEDFISELSKLKDYDGIALHHWGSIKEKIK